MNRDHADAQYQNVAYEYDSGFGYPQLEYEPKITGSSPSGNWESMIHSDPLDMDGGEVFEMSDILDIVNGMDEELPPWHGRHIVTVRDFRVGGAPIATEPPKKRPLSDPAEGESVGNAKPASYHDPFGTSSYGRPLLSKGPNVKLQNSVAQYQNVAYEYDILNSPEPFRAGNSDFPGSRTFITVTGLNQLAQAMASVNTSVGAVLTSTDSFISNPGAAKPLTLAPNMVH